MSRFVQFSLVQTATHWHNAQANRAMFDNWLDQVPNDTDVIVLPEMFNTGFTMDSHRQTETMSGATVQLAAGRGGALRQDDLRQRSDSTGCRFNGCGERQRESIALGYTGSADHALRQAASVSHGR